MASTLSPPGPVEDLLLESKAEKTGRPIFRQAEFAVAQRIGWRSERCSHPQSKRRRRKTRWVASAANRVAALSQESPDARESCAQSERNRSGLSIVEISWWWSGVPGGGTVDFRSSGRSVPPRFDFGQRERRFGRLQTGSAELKRRSQPMLLWPLIEAADFVPPRWSLSRLTGNRLLAVSCRRLPLCLVLGMDSAGDLNFSAAYEYPPRRIWIWWETG